MRLIHVGGGGFGPSRPPSSYVRKIAAEFDMELDDLKYQTGGKDGRWGKMRGNLVWAQSAGASLALMNSVRELCEPAGLILFHPPVMEDGHLLWERSPRDRFWMYAPAVPCPVLHLWSIHDEIVPRSQQVALLKWATEYGKDWQVNITTEDFHRGGHGGYVHTLPPSLFINWARERRIT